MTPAAPFWHDCPFPECHVGACRRPHNCAVPVRDVDDHVLTIVRKLAAVYTVDTDQVAFIRLVAEARAVLSCKPVEIRTP